MIQQLPVLIVIFGLICSTPNAHARSIATFNAAAGLNTEQTHLNKSDKATKVAIVVSDKAAKAAINLLSSVVESVGRSSKQNRIENDQVPAEHDGIVVESVEELDVKPPRSQNQRRLDLDFR